MENNYTIVPPEGMRTVINGNVITFEEIKKEVKETILPQSWEDLESLEGYYVDGNSEIKYHAYPLVYVGVVENGLMMI